MTKKPEPAALEAAKAVMKRMLATPPVPHEPVKRKRRSKGKRQS